MKFKLADLTVIGTCGAILMATFAGCSRPPTERVATGPAKEDKKIDPFGAALKTFRYPENPRENDDWTRFRAGIQQVDSHFIDAKVLARLQLSSQQRRFLERDLGLSPAEMAEIEATAFGAADAHYLDECFLLRDAAKALELRGLSTADQANVHFRWVMRNMLPCEQIEANIPPAFALRRGFGGAMERAMVFLALLRQTQIEGCLIVAPEVPPLRFLVAAHDAAKNKLVLFDPRLGLPVAGKNRKGIATLDEVVQDPALLKPSDFTPAQVEKLEAWVVCPLYALSPRMLELEKGLRGQDTVSLHLDAAGLRDALGKSASINVKLWKASVDLAGADALHPKTIPSPTRWLRAFLPKSEGGLFETNAGSDFFARAHLPLGNAMHAYEQVNLTQQLIPAPIFHSLQGVSLGLFMKYDMQTREMFLRGHFDAMKRRNERLQAFARRESLVGVAADPAFADERVDWVNKLRDAEGKSVDDPKAHANFVRSLPLIWMQDPLIRWLLDTDNEKQLERTEKLTVMSKILAVGTRDYFDFELARAQAAVGHERADRALTELRAKQEPDEYLRKDANSAWDIARSSWSNFYLQRIALPSTIEQQIEQMKRSRGPNGAPTALNVNMLEKLHLDIHKYFHARLRLAESIEFLDGGQEAKRHLEATKAEIEALEKKALPLAEIKRLRPFTPPGGEPNRLDLLEREWAPQGNYFWLKREIDERVARLP